MLRLLFFPFELAFTLMFLPLRLMVSFFRSGLWLGFALLFGVISLFAGIIRGILPLVLIGIGLAMIANAYKAAKAKKEDEPFVEPMNVRSFFSSNN